MTVSSRSNLSETSEPHHAASADAVRSLREYRLFQRGAIATVVMTCAILFSLNLVDPDLWGHVKYGQEAIADGALPETATHTYTAEGYRWINHENIAELSFALVYEYVGTLGLTLGKCLVGIGILVLMYLAARRHDAGPLLTWSLLLVVSLAMAPYFLVRPQLFSFALCAAMLFVLQRAFPEWPKQTVPKFGWLWCLPPIMAIWVNAHGGVVAGFCLLLPYLAGRGVEMLYRRGAAARRDVTHLAGIALASLATLLANPYGWKLPLWLALSLKEPRPEVTEWAALSLGDSAFVPFVILLALTIAAVVVDRRRRDWVHILLFAAVAWQAVAHVRHVAFFAILCGFWLPAPLCGLMVRLRGGAPQDLPEIVLAPWLRRGLVGLLAVAFCLQTFALTSRVSDLPVYRNMYPVDAIEFMAQRGLEGRMVASFNWAQYVLAALAPEVRLQFDGRYDTCYPPLAIDRHFDFLLGEHEGRRFRNAASGPIDGTAVLREGEPDLVLIDRAYTEAVQNMQREIADHPDKWVLLYQDGIAQLYGRSERFDDPASPQYVPPAERVENDETPTGFVSWPALPNHGLSRFVAR